LKKLSLALDQWKLGILQGKAVIGRIIAVVYPSEGAREPTLPDSLSTECRELSEIVMDLRKIAEQVKDIRNKFSALQDLSSMSGASEGNPAPLPEVNGNPVNLEELDSWVQRIHTVHQTQLGMCELVLNELCHLETRELALFHQGVWTLQPAVSSEVELYIACIKQILVLQPA